MDPILYNNAPSCPPNCAGGNEVVISPCYGNNAEYITISQPGKDSPLVFDKATVRLTSVQLSGTCCAENTAYVILSGHALYAAEMQLTVPPKPRMQTIFLYSNTTLISNQSYNSTEALYGALQNVVNDCDCNCVNQSSCEVAIRDIDLELDREGVFTWTVTYNSNAPYAYIRGISNDEQGLFFVQSTSNTQSIQTEDLVGTFVLYGSNSNPMQGVDDILCSDSIVVSTGTDRFSGVFESTLEHDCQGERIYSIIYTTPGSSASLSDNELTVNASQDTAVYVKVTCNGVLLAIEAFLLTYEP